MAEPELSTQDALTQIGEEMGTEALALVATLMDRNARETDFLKDQINHAQITDAIEIFATFEAFFDAVREVQERLDSLSLERVLGTFSYDVDRAARQRKFLLDHIDQLS